MAPVYDQLGKVIFGTALYKSSTRLLENPERYSSILIVGGGTGKILSYLEEKRYKGNVTYVEQSTGMMEKAKSRGVSFEVNWIQDDIRSGLVKKEYDCVHMAFFLDQFNKSQIKTLIDKIEKSVSPPFWLVTDFIPPTKPSQKFLIWLMYRFFRVTTRIAAQKLEDIKSIFIEEGYQLEKEHNDVHPMMRSWEFKHPNRGIG